MNEKKIVSSSPHLRSKDSARGIMLDVIIALFPALVASVLLFGLQALLLTVVCVVSAVGSEYICRRVMKRENTIFDLSAVVTGILLAFNLPVSLPLWMAVIGSVFAIVVVKQFFGGIGQNFVNPALVGRIVLMMSFPTQMSTWTQPLTQNGTAAITSATPMAVLGQVVQKGVSSESMQSANLPSMLEMFIGQRAGSMGEVCAVALLIGFLYLLVRRVISPLIPLVYIGAVALLMFFAGGFNLAFVGYEVLGGGLLLGAIFMATDYTTSPISNKGKLIYAAGCALLTTVIRLFGSLPEGVSFSIIIMNILVPHIERITTPKPFGVVKKKKGDVA